MKICAPCAACFACYAEGKGRNQKRRNIGDVDQPLGSYLKTHRKNAGLTQTDLATLIGFPSVTSVSNHEHLRTLPTLVTALAYEVVFQVPIAEMFPGVTEAVEHLIERNLLEFEARLKERTTTSDKSAASRKVEWIAERRAVVRRS